MPKTLCDPGILVRQLKVYEAQWSCCLLQDALYGLIALVGTEYNINGLLGLLHDSCRHFGFRIVPRIDRGRARAFLPGISKLTL